MAGCLPQLPSLYSSRRRFTFEEMHSLPVSFEDVATACYRIKSGIVMTECKWSEWLSAWCKMDVCIKKDYRQITGSFKERGARNALMLLSDKQKETGVMAASAGNHAQALAYHGFALGIPVTCLMPVVAPMTKVANCRKMGADVIIHGENIEESKNHAMETPSLAEKVYINGYDHPAIIAGAGTMGVEILDQVKGLDAIVVPVGGGGLIAGIALAVKTLSPSTRIIGVEPEFCPSMKAAVDAGSPTKVKSTPTLADGLNVPLVGSNAFDITRLLVDKLVTVSEKSIALAVLRMIEHEHVVLEGGGAAGLAAIFPEGPLHEELRNKRVAIPLCGSNIDVTTLGRVIDRGLAADSRLVRFVTVVKDVPGGIANLTKDIADNGASIRDIYHERAWLHTHVDMVQVKVVVEVTGAEHMTRVRQNLESKGYDLAWGIECNDTW